jgi:peptidoglycan hydrolase-like protein with peptidoglycan-binding domain
MAVNTIKLKRWARQESYLLGTLVLFLTSYGCAIFSGLSESEVKVVEPPAPAVYNPTEPIASDPPTPVKTEPNGPVSSLKKPLSKQEIRQIQARLKAAGFDPGPIDGVLGPRTKSVLLRVQAGCTIVNDLVATSDRDLVASAADTQAPELTGSVSTLTKAEIELLQTRLKAAGYDPGPIDGIMGARTRFALSRCKAGCSALYDLVGGSDKRVSEQTAEIPSPGASASATPAVSINKVSGRPEIRLTQQRLKAAGFDPGPIDGILGAQTKSALEKYRSSQKVKRPNVEALADY